jgi:hypothetical protein
LAFSPLRSAIAATDAPGWRHARTTSALNWALCLRRVTLFVSIVSTCLYRGHYVYPLGNRIQDDLPRRLLFFCALDVESHPKPPITEFLKDRIRAQSSISIKDLTQIISPKSSKVYKSTLSHVGLIRMLRK